jgi:hypothetical protein
MHNVQIERKKQIKPKFKFPTKYLKCYIKKFFLITTRGGGFKQIGIQIPCYWYSFLIAKYEYS